MHKVVATLLFAAVPVLSHASDCASARTAAVPLQPAVLAAVAPELVAPSYRLGAHGGVLSRAYGEAQSVEQVLLRLRIEGCQNVALAMPHASVVSSADPAAYVPQTEFDNTPYRFNMTQEGRRMTADDFDAWLQANGYSVGRRVDPNAPAEAGLPDLLPAAVEAAVGE